MLNDIASVSAVRASRQSILKKHSYSRSESISDEDSGSEADSELKPLASATEFNYPHSCEEVSSSTSLALSGHDPSPYSEATLGSRPRSSSPGHDSSDGD